MTKKHTWSAEEDQILLKLRHERKVTKWVQIAAIMNQEFHCRKLNGKQCRDRYVNKLSQTLEEREWQKEEDLELIEMHRFHGRRWSLMSQQLKGRSQNSIKNHFYSRLRKTLRDLNRIISGFLPNQFERISVTFLNKVLLISGEDSGFDEDLTRQAEDIVQFLFWGFDCREKSGSLSSLVEKLHLIQALGGMTKKPKYSSQENRPKKDDQISQSPDLIKLQAPPSNLFQPYFSFILPQQ